MILGQSAMTKFDPTAFRAKLDDVRFDEFWQLLEMLQSVDDELSRAEEKLSALHFRLNEAERLN